MMLFNHQSSIVNRKFPQRGQVLVEFALGAVGLVAIAFLMARVGLWLSDSLVTRNRNFRLTRLAAGQSSGLTGFAAPGNLHLLGPGPASSGGQGPQGASTYTTSCPAGDSFLSQAYAKRLQAADLMVVQGPAKRTEVIAHHTAALLLVFQANYLGWDAIIVDEIRDDADSAYDSLDDIDARLNAIHNLPIVQGTGIHNFCDTSLWGNTLCYIQPLRGLFQIDERLAAIKRELDASIAGTVAYRIALYQLRLVAIGTRLGQITTRLNQINTQLFVDADGSGPLTVGVFERIAELQPAVDACQGIPDPNAWCDSVEQQMLWWETIRDNLVNERNDLINEQSNLVAERDQIQNTELPPLYDLRNDLIGERDALQLLDDEVNSALGLHAAKLNLLNQVDAIVDRWESLWASLPGAGGALYPDDLSTKFQQGIYLLDVSNNPASGEPSYSGDLAVIIVRLWWMAQQRLDTAESKETQFPIPPVPPNFSIPDNVNPGEYEKANALVQQLRQYADQIKTLILEAEQWERQAHSVCVSGQDP